MPTVRVNKRFTVNMGNYESYSPEFSIELPVRETYTEDGDIHDNAYKEALERANRLVDEAAYHDLKEAAQITDVRNSYVLTWLFNREDEDYANKN